MNIAADTDPASIQQKRILLIIIFLVMARLILTQLGHYALWDDEAITALGGKGVLRTGDTSVFLDHGNIVAYRNGLDIVNGCDRALPPLQSYVTAASFALFGIDAWTARLPFALFGLATVALILYWARQQSWTVLLVLAAGLIGNISFILFVRQCRYYALAIFFSTAITYVYWKWKPDARTMAVLAALLVLLFASNYMSYLALGCCLALDYAIWRHKEWAATWREAAILIVPQIIFIGAIASIWNPLKTQFGTYEAANTLAERALLYFWYWRDMGRSEFFTIPILLLALGVGIWQRRLWMVRGGVAMILYTAVIAALSPQRLHPAIEGEVRYLAPLIPLALVLQTGALCSVLERRKIVLLLVTLMAFGTNLLNGGPFETWGFRSTFLSYLGELSLPQTEPYTPAADWINANVPDNASVLVEPYYMTYPLMFHAPRALYAWQLDWPPRPDFAGLPPINFIGRVPPDYIVGFGPIAAQVMQAFQRYRPSGLRYQQVATLPVFWLDCYRPEIYWRKFDSVTTFDPATDAIYIFQRVSPPITPKPGGG